MLALSFLAATDLPSVSTEVTEAVLTIASPGAVASASGAALTVALISSDTLPDPPLSEQLVGMGYRPRGSST